MVIVRPPAPKPSPPPEKRIIVIDPGHGGVDPGATGSAMKILEKNVALRTGLALRNRLEASGRYQVIMTRHDDRIVRLRDRLKIARESGGELFVSLHADSLRKAPHIRGASVYTCPSGPRTMRPPVWPGKKTVPISWPASICPIRRTSSRRS